MLSASSNQSVSHPLPFPPVIELQNLSFSYPTPAGDIPVLRGIDLTLREGETVALIGANGSGKTTLIRCLNGLLQPSDGDVRVDGLSVRSPQHIHEIRRRVGMVFQNPDDQIVSAQVEREIAFGLENLGVPTTDMRQRVADALERFGLARYRHHTPHLLSGGERQRLAIASVVVMRPRYLLLDEPTALLDPAGRRAFLGLLDAFHRAGDITPILVTQIPEEAARADRVIALHQGQVALDGPPREIFSRTGELARINLAPPVAARIAATLGLPPPLPITAGSLVERLPNPPPTPPASDVSSPPAAASGPPVVCARGLRHIYNPGLPTQTVAFHDLDLDVSRGESLALIGPSGSGKSTFAQHLNGLLLPTSGSLTVCGVDLATSRNLRDLRRRVGLIFQFPETQLFADTVFEDVAFGPRNLGLSDIDARVRQALSSVGLPPSVFFSRSPLSLSGGEKRRVAIAGVLAMRPEVLALDEPTAGLDPAGAAEIETLLTRLRDDGCTVLLISHDMDLVARLSGRVVALDAGRLAFDAPPPDAFSDRRRLLDLNLDLPEAAQIADALRSKAWPIPPHALTANAVARSLRETLHP